MGIQCRGFTFQYSSLNKVLSLLMLEIVVGSSHIGWLASSHASLVDATINISSTLIQEGGGPSSTPPKSLISLQYTWSLRSHLLCCEQ